MKLILGALTLALGLFAAVPVFAGGPQRKAEVESPLLSEVEAVKYLTGRGIHPFAGNEISVRLCHV